MPLYNPPVSDRDVATTFLRWTWTRAVFHRGYWLVTSLYLVVEADLSPFQLVFLGTAQGLTALAFEVPTGVLADTVSRKWSIVIAHVVIGISMLATGLLTSFPALVVTQMLWGLGWTFSSGAEVAWLTDELDRPDRVASVLTASARWERIGAACGMVGFGSLAWATDLSTAIVASGLAMLVLGLFVAARFTERRFTPAHERRWRESLAIFRRGVELARRDRELLLVLAATLLVNGAAEGFGRLYPRQLLELGLSEQPDPIVWLTALGLVALAVGALALRVVEARIDGAAVAPRAYAAACFVGALGLIVLAHAPDEVTGMAGVLLVSGVAWPVTRVVSVIWVNRRVTSDVRATVQSFLAQAEYVGEISLGLALGVLAQATSIGLAMIGACALVAGAGLMAVRSRAGRAPSVGKVDE
jgi:MFS family permease